MEEKIARFISWILHPLLMPSYALLLQFYLKPFYVVLFPSGMRTALAVIFIGNTVLLPAIIIWLMRQRNVISDIHLPDRRERTFPFIIAVITYTVTYFMLVSKGLPPVYLKLLLGGAILISVSLLVNMFWKISLHMIGIGGLAGIFAGLMYTGLLHAPGVLILSLLLAGFTGFARLKLNTHNEAQVYSGFIAGAAIMFLVFTLL